MKIAPTAVSDKSTFSAFIVAAFPSITQILGTAQPAWKALRASWVHLTRGAITNASLAVSSSRAATYLGIAAALLAAGGAL